MFEIFTCLYKEMSCSGYKACGEGKTISTKGKSCPVCLEEFTKDAPAFAGSCGHAYHPACLSDWGDSQQRMWLQHHPYDDAPPPTCPMCRENISDTATSAWCFNECCMDDGKGGLPQLPNSVKLQYIKNCLKELGNGGRIPFERTYLLEMERKLEKRRQGKKKKSGKKKKYRMGSRKRRSRKRRSRKRQSRKRQSRKHAVL